MAHLLKSYCLMPRDYLKAGEVSIQIQNVLKTIGFEPDTVRRASICTCESEMNGVMPGGEGTFVLNIDPEYILMEVNDDGPGKWDSACRKRLNILI